MENTYRCCDKPVHASCDVYISEPPKGEDHKSVTLRNIYEKHPNEWVKLYMCETFFANIYSFNMGDDSEFIIDQPKTESSHHNLPLQPGT
jgi:hypothetical protein